MLTKGAIGNLINRYRAVLRKCHLLNTFGSLAVASMLVLGGAGVAGATIVSGELSNTISGVTSATNIIFNKGENSLIRENIPGNEGGSPEHTAVIVPLIRVESFNYNSETNKVILNGGLATGEKSSATMKELSVDNNGVINIKEANFSGDAESVTHSYVVDGAAISAYAINGATAKVSFNISDSNFSNFSVKDTSISGAYSSTIGIGSAENVTLTNVTMSNNTATSTRGYTQGGAFHQSGGTLTADNITLSNNKAVGHQQALGGAMVLSGVTAEIKNSTFSGNSAVESESTPRGGAIYLYSNTQLTLSDSLFENNLVQGSEDAGASGGAITVSNGQTLEATNVTFKGNKALSTTNGLGGAIHNRIGASTTLKGGNIFAGNTASTAGGAICNEGTITFSGTNSFSDNTAADKPNDIYNEGTLNFGAESKTEMEALVNAGGTITFGDKANLTVSKSFISDSGLTIDNGANVTIGGTVDVKHSSSPSTTDKNTAVHVSDGASLTLNADTTLATQQMFGVVVDGGEATINGQVSGSYAGVRVVNTGDAAESLATVKDGTTIANGDYGVLVYDKSKLIVEGGQISAKGYAISGNGTRGGSVVEISGGTISGGDLGIYQPADGNLTITGGNISGNTGIEVRGSGKVAISGNATVTGATEGFAVNKNGNGNTLKAVALGISQHTTDLQPLNVTISGGTFTGEYALYETDVEGGAAPLVSLDITGGTFNGEIYSQNVDNFISGGTFSHLSALNYLADGADIHASAAEANITEETGHEEAFFLDGKKASITFDAPSVKLTGDLGTKNSGNLTVKADGTVAISGKLDNEGTLNINVGTFNLSDGHLCGSGDTGVFNITATEDITLSGGKKPVINTGGKITIAAGGNLTINGTTIAQDKLDGDDMDEVGELIGKTVAIITSKEAQSFTAGKDLSIGGDIIAMEKATVALKADTGSITGNIQTTDGAKVTMDGAFTMDGAIAENSDVTVASGSLTVDASTLSKEGAASDVTTGIKSSLTVAENAALNVDFANLANKTYTAAQLSAAEKALFDGDKGTLNFLNATLVIDEVKEKIVIGAEVKTDKDGKTVIQLVNPTVIPHDADHIDDGQKVNYQHHLVIDVVDPDDPHKRQKAPDILVADHDGLQQLSRFEVDKDDHRIEYVFDEHIKNPVFQGGETINDGFAYDQNDKPIKFDMTAKAGMFIEHGDPNEKGNQKGIAGNVIVEEKGRFRVNGTDHKKTEFHYDLIATAGDSDIAHASVKTKEFAPRKGTFVIDPAYFKADSVTSNITGGIGVGIGSVMQFGEVTDFEYLVTKAGLTPEVNPVGIGFLVQGKNAVLAVGQNITLGDDTGAMGTLLVDGTKTNTQLKDTLTSNAGGATFASSSLLVVEGDICSGNTAAITDASSSASSSKLTVESGAKLAVAGASANKTYTITSGFAPDSAVNGWDKVVVNKMLTATMSYDKNGTVTVTTEEVQDAATTFPGIIAENNLNTMMQNGLADDDSADMGIRFLTRAIDTGAGYLAEDKIVDTVNEVSRAAVTAGVQNTALRIADAASNTVIGHLSLSQHDGSKSIHADGADFWAAPMYGNLYTSGMVTDGASVRGQFGGLALGADLEAGQFLGGKFRLGAAINGGGGQSETKGNATSTQNDYDFGGLNFYAGWNNGALNVIGSVGYGFGNHEVEMSAPVLGNAKADVDTTVFTADLRAEYQLKTEWVDLLPHAGVRYTALRTGAHDLKVGGDVLNSVERDTQNIVQFPVGVTLSKDVAFADWNVKPMVDVSVIPAAGDKKANTKVRFSGIDAVDGVNSRIMDSTSWAGTIGVQAEKGDFTLGLNYGVQASSNETDQNVQLKLGWKF